MKAYLQSCSMQTQHHISQTQRWCALTFLQAPWTVESRTNKTERVDVVAELIEDYTGNHQACHKHRRQKTQLSICQIEVCLRFVSVFSFTPAKH